MSLRRREFLKAASAAGIVAAASLPNGCTLPANRATAASVVVIGGGYGGATAAKYLRLWSDGAVKVTLVEANAAFVSCPLSNLVLGGSKSIADLTVSYDRLRARGVAVVHARASAVDPVRRLVHLASGQSLPYDRLILSPGIDFFFDRLPSLDNAKARAKVLHAWKAGPQTVALRQQLETMRDGGTFAISIPRAPYRCPPAPYERACQVAWYCQRAKPRSKVLILDGNEDVQSKKALFVKAWSEQYKNLVEYRPDHVLTDVDMRTLTAKFETADDVKADVLNVIPPHGAGAIARQAGVITANDQWCEVDFLTFESIRVNNVHVLGDAIQVAPLMPKSAHMANQQAKVCAAAVLQLLVGQPVNPAPVVNNACYSFITDKDVVHIASVHQYDRLQRTFIAVPDAGGLSPAMNALEGAHAFSWARNIWNDALG